MADVFLHTNVSHLLSSLFFPLYISSFFYVCHTLDCVYFGTVLVSRSVFLACELVLQIRA